MKTVVELKERNRVTIPLPIVQGLGLQIGDLVEINIEVVKRTASVSKQNTEQEEKTQ